MQGIRLQNYSILMERRKKQCGLCRMLSSEKMWSAAAGPGSRESGAGQTIIKSRPLRAARGLGFSNHGIRCFRIFCIGI